MKSDQVPRLMPLYALKPSLSYSAYVPRIPKPSTIYDPRIKISLHAQLSVAQVPSSVEKTGAQPRVKQKPWQIMG